MPLPRALLGKRQAKPRLADVKILELHVREPRGKPRILNRQLIVGGVGRNAEQRLQQREGGRRRPRLGLQATGY
jgi:hypothetical protein